MCLKSIFVCLKSNETLSLCVCAHAHVYVCVCVCAESNETDFFFRIDINSSPFFLTIDHIRWESSLLSHFSQFLR